MVGAKFVLAHAQICAARSQAFVRLELMARRLLTHIFRLTNERLENDFRFMRVCGEP